MPADLHRKQKQKSTLEVYAPYLLILCMIILVLLIIGLIIAMAHVHAFQLTGTEANLHQNLEAII